MAVTYGPIMGVGVIDGQGMMNMDRIIEKASQTFKQGVPITLTGHSGTAAECAFGGAEIVYGVSLEGGHNLASAAVDPVNKEYSFGTPANQTAARIHPAGTWPVDGRVGFMRADGRNIFAIMLKDGQVFTNAMVGTAYGLTKDGTTGFWYLDNTDTSGDNVVAVVYGVDPNSPNSATLGARVFFQFAEALRAF